MSVTFEKLVVMRQNLTLRNLQMQNLSKQLTEIARVI